jgi:hypothetical protein
MRVLIPDVTATKSADVAAYLAASGHVVFSCNSPGDTGTACAALKGQRCPVERDALDVAVVVPVDRMQPQGVAADGAKCAARRRIPMVVGTSHAEGDRWWCGDGTDGTLLGALDHTARLPLQVHSDAATAMVRTILDRHGIDAGPATVNVYRRNGRLRAEVDTGAPVAIDVTRVIAVRVPQAIRQIDPWAAGLDVLVTPSGAA